MLLGDDPGDIALADRSGVDEELPQPHRRTVPRPPQRGHHLLGGCQAGRDEPLTEARAVRAHREIRGRGDGLGRGRGCRPRRHLQGYLLPQPHAGMPIGTRGATSMSLG